MFSAKVTQTVYFPHKPEQINITMEVNIFSAYQHIKSAYLVTACLEKLLLVPNSLRTRKSWKNFRV